ncbi:MAG: winged helix-turn-helix domain-containing tetratricopeptide repeat protein [Amaricoccus sp.]
MPGQVFAFGPFVLEPDTGTLLRQGVPVPVGYRGALLLAELLRRPGDVLTKSELLDAGWRGMTVEEGNLSVQIAGLRRLLGSAGDGSDWIATVPRVGYRFVGAVTRGDAAPSGAAGPADGPSIAVLPFTNLSGDPEQEHFAEGLAEDIITRLSRVRALFVSARNASFAYKGRTVELKQIGRELGVRYMLEGSVRRSGQRLRATALLNDAATGRQVWAGQYDGEIADFFGLQDRIAESVIAAIEPQIYAAEHTRLRTRPPESLDAWGFVMQAMPYVWTWGSAADIEIAQRLLGRALAVDPGYPRANSLLAWTYAAQAQLGWADPPTVLPLALAQAQTGIGGDPDDPWGHLAAGYVHMVARRFRPALDELQEAIERNPSLALAHVILGSAYSHAGLPEDGLHQLAIAARLGTRDYTQAANLASAGLCHFVARRFTEAIDCERRAVQLRPNFGTAWRTLAASAGLAGEAQAAAAALAEARRTHPGLSVEWIEKYHPLVHEHDRALFVQGLRAAGLE